MKYRLWSKIQNLQTSLKLDLLYIFFITDERPRRHQLVKQDSIISFADQPRSYLTKQDSTLSGSHTSILKKTDSRTIQSSSASPVRKTIGFFHE